jgi:hypothetical protein
MKLITNSIIDSFYKEGKNNRETDLCIILKKFGSDKCSDWHNYSTLYDFIFFGDREKDLKIFEVGIYGGSSVRSWKEYFKNSQIYCGDVNREYFVKEDRIESFFCDQDRPKSIREMWENDKLKNIDFDVIIDDGKHEYVSNINFLENSYHKLKKGGFFIIEDLTKSTLNSFRDNIEELERIFKPRYIQILEIPNSHNTIDNNILLIQK